MLDEVVLPPGLTLLSPGANCCLGSDPSVGRETTRHAGGGSDLVGACCLRHPSLDCPTTAAPCPPCQCEPEDGHDHDRRRTPLRHRRGRHPPRCARRCGRHRRRWCAGHRAVPDDCSWLPAAADLDAWLRPARPGRRGGTGTYGVSLARHLRAGQVAVVEVMRPNRQVRRRHGKTDVVDAIAAARAVLSGEANATPKTHDGPVEALRTLCGSTPMITTYHARPSTQPDGGTAGDAPTFSCGAQSSVESARGSRHWPTRRTPAEPARRRQTVHESGRPVPRAGR